MFISSSHVLTIPSSLVPHPHRHLQTCFLLADSTRFREPGYVVLKASHRTVTSSACFSRLQATERLVLLPSPERWTKQQTVRLSRRTLTDPPYLVGFKDRSGRSIANDVNSEWVQPASNEMFRVLKDNSLAVSFYGWNRVDIFMQAWKAAGFRVVGHIVFTKPYASKSAFVGYQHESAYVLAKGRPALPAKPLPDVMPWEYTGNRYHPTEKPVSALRPLIETFTQPGDIVLDPFAGSGSTCVAAQECGRRWIGIELMEQYHAAGLRRLYAHRDARAA